MASTKVRKTDAEHEITHWLHRWRQGDLAAENELANLIYPTLRAIARKHAGGRGELTLSATELANEAYMSLAEQRSFAFLNREHFFAIAARLVRRILVDHLRERSADKRGGHWKRVTLSHAADIGIAAEMEDSAMLRLDTLLERLAHIDARAAKGVELRFFTGLSMEEVAEATNVSLATVKRDWQFARAWLKHQLDSTE